VQQDLLRTPYSCYILGEAARIEAAVLLIWLLSHLHLLAAKAGALFWLEPLAPLPPQLQYDDVIR
jgi:hypothetical protein